jgi:hypothetical protein
VVEEGLILVNTEAPGEEADELLFNNLHLTLDINGLEAAKKVTRLGLLIQIDHAYRLTKQLGQMLQSRCLANAGLTAQQHRLVTLDTSGYLLYQTQCGFRVDEFAC